MSRVRTYLQFFPVTVVALVGALVAVLAGPTVGTATVRAGSIEGFRLAAANPSAILVNVSAFRNGESTNELHPRIGDVQDVQVSLARGSTRASLGDIILTRPVDSYSTQFAERLSNGRRIATVTIYLEKSEPTTFDVATYVLSNVVVVSDRVSFNSDQVASERVALAAQQIDLKYKSQKPDGSIGSTFEYCWDFAKNVDCTP